MELTVPALSTGDVLALFIARTGRDHHPRSAQKRRRRMRATDPQPDDACARGL